MSTVRRSGKAIIADSQATGRVLADFLHRPYSVKRARIVLAIALNFCLSYAIGLGTIDAAVRLRNCNGALASRILALSLTLNIHSFTSRRAGTFRTNMCTTRATSPGRKADKDRLGFGRFQKFSSANGVMKLPSMTRPFCLRNLCHRQERASEREVFDVQQSRHRNDSRRKLLVQPLRSTTSGCKHWPYVARKPCSRACQLRLDRSAWQSQDSGCLKD